MLYLINMFILLLLPLYTYSQFATNSIPATQKMTDTPYFQAQMITLSSSSLGLTSFSGLDTIYSVQVALSRQLNDMIDQNLITSAYVQNNSNGQIDYFLTSKLTNSNTTAYVTLEIGQNTQIILLRVTLIILTNLLQTPNPFVSLFEKTVGASSLEYIQPYDLPNCQFQVYVKSVRALVTGTLSGNEQSFGFRTLTERSSDGKTLSIGFEMDNLAITYDINVTYVVIVWNQVLYGSTAQFVNLKFATTSGELLSSPGTVVIPQFNSTFMTNTIIGQQQFLGISTQKPSFTFTLNSNEITYTTNGITSFTYSILQVIDYHCPTESPFKFKSDPLCYSCPQSMIYVNTSEAFNQHRSTINAGECYKINITNSGYNFDRVTGKIVNVCGCCKQCQLTSYLDACECRLCKEKLSNCMECDAIGGSCSKCASGYEIVDLDNDSATINSVCVEIARTAPVDTSISINKTNSTSTMTTNNSETSSSVNETATVVQAQAQTDNLTASGTTTTADTNVPAATNGSLTTAETNSTQTTTQSGDSTAMPTLNTTDQPSPLNKTNQTTFSNTTNQTFSLNTSNQTSSSNTTNQTVPSNSDNETIAVPKNETSPPSSLLNNIKINPFPPPLDNTITSPPPPIPFLDNNKTVTPPQNNQTQDQPNNNTKNQSQGQNNTQTNNKTIQPPPTPNNVTLTELGPQKITQTTIEQNNDSNSQMIKTIAIVLGVVLPLLLLGLFVYFWKKCKPKRISIFDEIDGLQGSVQNIDSLQLLQEKLKDPVNPQQIYFDDRAQHNHDNQNRLKLRQVNMEQIFRRTMFSV